MSCFTEAVCWDTNLAEVVTFLEDILSEAHVSQVIWDVCRIYYTSSEGESRFITVQDIGNDQVKVFAGARGDAVEYVAATTKKFGGVHTLDEHEPDKINIYRRV